MQIGVSNNGYIVIIDSDAETYWQKGELQPTFEGDTLIIRERDNRRDIIVKANYDEIENASTGEPFDTLESLKEFVQDNFFF